MTLLQRIAEHAVTRPEQAALTGLDSALDYATLFNRIQALSARFKARNYRVMGLAIDNTPDWVVVDLAAQLAGVCLVPLPPFFSPQQVQHALRLSGADAVITDNPEHLRAVAGGLLGDTTQQVTITEQPLLVYSRPTASHILAEDIVKVTFTSGTTGEPKGVMLRQAQIDTVVASLVNAVQAEPGDRHLALMPLAVLLENLAGVYASLWAGANVLLPGLAAVGLQGAVGLDIQQFATILGHSHPTTLIITPQLLPALIALHGAQPQLLESLRFIALGGAPVSKQLLQQADAMGLPVYEGYGLSECASVTTLNTPRAHRPGSVGKPLPHIQLSISEQGEVLIKGHDFAGYLGQPNAVESGVWHSGDLGYLDDEGYLYLTGRKRNVFITAMGRNVSPEWVERELILAPAIQQVAVFGEARHSNTAVVVPAAKTDTEDLWQAIEATNARLPDYARISHLLIADEPFSPMNRQLSGTGRNRREAIYDSYRDRIEQFYLQEQKL